MASIKETTSDGQTLRISDILSFTEVAEKINKDISQIESIRAIEIIETDEEDGVERTKEQMQEIVDRFCRDIATVMDNIREEGKLENFKWKGDQLYVGTNRIARPLFFWEALWKNSGTFIHLEMDFYPHEVHDVPTAPMAPMENLQTLILDVSSAHGDDGAAIIKILHNAPNIKNLTLDLPICDLEGCRIKNMSYDYTFPKLEILDFSVFIHPDITPVTDFLLRHPSVTTLTWNLDTDWDEVKLNLPEDAFPNVQALKFPMWRLQEDQNILRVVALPKLAHMRVSYSDARTLAEVATVSGRLRCLELGHPLGIQEFRPEEPKEPDSDSDSDDKDVVPEPRLLEVFKKILPSFTELQEIAFDMDTANSWFHPANEKEFRLQQPIDYNDLISVLECLPSQSKIRALRLLDSRGKELPAEFLEDMPGVPESLEFLRWDIGGEQLLYRLERKDGKTRAVRHEPLRVSNDANAPWPEQRILDY